MAQGFLCAPWIFALLDSSHNPLALPPPARMLSSSGNYSEFFAIPAAGNLEPFLQPFGPTPQGPPCSRALSRLALQFSVNIGAYTNFFSLLSVLLSVSLIPPPHEALFLSKTPVQHDGRWPFDKASVGVVSHFSERFLVSRASARRSTLSPSPASRVRLPFSYWLEYPPTAISLLMSRRRFLRAAASFHFDSSNYVLLNLVSLLCNLQSLI